ncbi:NtaA/DmoA family FMN-dependent monooxygenase [Microbacterium sp. E-13]|uniref:NtaA/DmoA family FMN-dependent monooxygenase n=1 Tax=Microbacterium sp. E-13 TaxID=3404048 RepID=UPI003CFA24DD
MAHGHMILSAILQPGGYDARAWRLPDSRAEEIGTFGILSEIAQRYEAAKLDSLFMADTISARPLLTGDVKLGAPYEALTALSSLVGVTSRIGLIATMSTTFNHPFTLARQIGALDSLSGGRAGWNIVTSNGAGENHGIELPSKVDRYRRAAEFVEVVRGLWTAWSDEAVVVDREGGRWLDSEKLRGIDHTGEFFRVEGYTNQRRSPQGHPVLIQAGQSESGLDFGADVAEIVYTVNPQKEKAIEYYGAYKANVASRGRNPDHVKIIPGLSPYIGRTEKEARDLYESLVEFIDFDDARVTLSRNLGADVSDLDLNEKIPLERFENIPDATVGRLAVYRHLTVEEDYTLRDILINWRSVTGHAAMVGTASHVADRMVDWFESRACDGFSLNAPTFPASVDAICEQLVPELQSRGYFREEYTETTLRGHLGLPVPPAWDAVAEA